MIRYQNKALEATSAASTRRLKSHKEITAQQNNE